VERSRGVAARGVQRERQHRRPVGGGGVHAGYVPAHGHTPEADARRAGEYKTILQLVGVLSHGKTAKMLADRAIDLMQDVQNLRKAIYPYVAVLSSIFPPLIRKCSFKLKLDTMPKGTEQYRKLSTTAVNYLCVHSRFDPRQPNSCIDRYRYGTLITFANYLIECRENTLTTRFPAWLAEHREISNLLSRTSLD
jgi:hypothetical protein